MRTEPNQIKPNHVPQGGTYCFCLILRDSAFNRFSCAELPDANVRLGIAGIFCFFAADPDVAAFAMVTFVVEAVGAGTGALAAGFAAGVCCVFFVCAGAPFLAAAACFCPHSTHIMDIWIRYQIVMSLWHITRIR